MAWGEQAAEQWEQDQPSVPVTIWRPNGTPGELSAGDAAVLASVLKASEETPAERTLDATELRGD